MDRLTFRKCRESRLPSAIGKTDYHELLDAVNAAQAQLLTAGEAGDEGWAGTWAEMVFEIDRCHPYLTTPRGVARLEAIAPCGTPIPVRNQFYEYLLFGNGRLPKDDRWQHWNVDGQAMERNNAVTFIDLNTAHGAQNVIVFMSPADIAAGKKVLIQGNDATGQPVWTKDDHGHPMQGEWITGISPFASSQFQYTKLTGIQKDPTDYPTQIFQLDPVWGLQEPLVVMEPSETTAWYRRYYLNSLPYGCCHSRSLQSDCGCGCGKKREMVLVYAIAKLDLVPVTCDTDYCLIQNLEAIIAQAQSNRYQLMDTTEAAQKAAERHHAAISLLQGELAHKEGKNNPSISFQPFGSAHLRKYGVGAQTFR
jgi:hypothetical protein